MNDFRGIRLLIASAGLFALACAPALPEGYMSATGAGEILAKTREIRLEATLAHLSEPERLALERLLEAGPIFQRLYEQQMHAQSIEAGEALVALDRKLGSPTRTRSLIDLYRLFQGPIATTLDNRRVPFLPVAPERPGKTLYPGDADSATLARWVAGHPEALDPRSVVRRANPNQIAADLAAIDAHPLLAAHHAEVRARLEVLAASPSDTAFYALPYAVAYAPDIVAAHDALAEAAELVAPADAAFASYLKLRAQDLISNDYSAGDSAWVTGRFENLNAQIGAYETYGDALYGVKTFFGLSLLVRDREASEAIARVSGGIQRIENSLPYAPHSQIRENIPVGVYQVVADFGDPRGTNTATILPNDPRIARKFGRTILLRGNIMREPSIFSDAQQLFRAAVADEHADDLGIDGSFNRTVWHEIGHYLGPALTADGRDLDEALTDASALLEEMKADLISLFAAKQLRADGYYDDASLRSVYASGILRVMQRVKPRRDQAYGTMQLIQFNHFFEHGVLFRDEASGRLRIDYERYHQAVADLLAQVLAIQQAGDRGAADALIARESAWEPGLHEAIAERMRAVEASRYRLVRFAALGE